MRKRKGIVRLLALGLSILTLSAQGGFGMVSYAAENNVQMSSAEEEDNANSWRYQDGELKEETSFMGLLSTFSAKAADTPKPWTKVNGSFVNSALEPIKGASLKGIDVSHYQGNIDWGKVKKSDVDFAIIRCGYGQDYTSQDDKYWKKNADACTEYDIPFGTYLYSYADTAEKAVSEAKHVLRLIKGYDLRYPVYYDLEDQSLRNLSPAALGKIASAFCETIEEAGYEAAVYANTDWFTNRLTDPVFNNWDRWVAQYNTVCKYTGKYNMWQCTSKGSVSGINGNTDINFLIGEEPAAEVSNITLNKKSASLQKGDTLKLSASAAPKNAFNKSLKWSSSDKSVVEVNNGTVTAVGSGTANITVTSAQNSKIKVSCKITVTGGAETGQPEQPETGGGSEMTPENIKPNKITLDKTKLTLTAGASSTVKAAIQPDGVTEEKPEWKSSNTGVASVNSSGKITAKAPGKAVITAQLGNLKDSCTVTVSPKTVSSFSYKPASESSVQLSWKKVTGASGYSIYRYDTKTKKDVLIKNTGAGTLSYTVKKINGSSGSALAAGAAYTFRIAPYKTIDGKKVYGSKKSVNAGTKPKKASLKKVSRVSSSKAKIQWGKVSSAGGYVIYISEKQNSGYKALKTLTSKSTSFTASGLKKGKKYYIKIATFKKLDGKIIYGNYSGIKSVKI